MEVLSMIKKPRICIPIISDNLLNLIDEVNAVIAMQPDLVEWRSDYFKGSEVELEKALGEIYKLLNAAKIPILFTLRSANEGGMCSLADNNRLAVIQKAIATDKIKYVDIELDISTGQDSNFDHDEITKMFNHTIDLAHTHNVDVIISNHNFKLTPSFEDMIAIIRRAQRLKADYVKLAYNADNGDDVLSLLAACEYGKDVLNQKMIALSIGDVGKVTRAVCGEFGSDITFAKGLFESAPGQIAIDSLRNLWSESLSGSM